MQSRTTSPKTALPVPPGKRVCPMSNASVGACFTVGRLPARRTSLRLALACCARPSPIRSEDEHMLRRALRDGARMLLLWQRGVQDGGRRGCFAAISADAPASALSSNPVHRR
ncbi:hypothetical protein C2E23DRAFT_399220 [Lenzites betulinus]|nr:hypothetical protein C2E23DRAFT_399220 [Lenzites betulinus]